MLILLHGLSATGKTTLGNLLAKRLECAFVSKDVIKERLHDADPGSVADIASSMALGSAAFDLTYKEVGSALQDGVCVAETVWHPGRAEGELRRVLKGVNTLCVQIFLTCEEGERMRRFRERAMKDRHAVHMDISRLSLKPDTRDREQKNRPLALEGTCIKLDTTDFASLDIDALIAQIKKTPEWQVCRGAD